MKNALSIFIGFLILISTFHKTLVFGFYEIKKDYVIEQLCVNKNVKNSCCFGKCFLEKQTSEKEAKGIIINLLKNIKEELFIEEIISFDTKIIASTYFIISNKISIPSNYPNGVFHPPIFAI